MKPIQTDFQWIKADGKPTQYFADLMRSISFGTTTSDSALAGYIGELKIAGPADANLTSGTPMNATSINLTPGDWDLFAPVHFLGVAATTVTELEASISTTSATQDGTTGHHGHWRGPAHADMHFTMLLGPVRASIAAATTYYLVAEAIFAVSTYKANGLLYARRAR
jgi:hypothetical protein